ncbi:Lrp/AsnC family transcriptional regulator [Microbacterium kribbense]|uniref:Lrp/AsnC family transcriptional regulator n=2 Tax=Microbacterium kribbense TaxID=433645 RepID=A0ABP7GKW3_9MICO
MPPAARVLDDTDHAILRELTQDGRLTNSELAARVGIAPSTCHARVRALVSTGVITGFHAEIDPAATGRQLEALIAIRLHAHARGGLRAFQRYLSELPATRRVYFVSGERDFLVHVAVADSAGLRRLVGDTLSVREEVAATNTSIIFEHVPGIRTAL